jgi:hypothetical protein
MVRGLSACALVLAWPLIALCEVSVEDSTVLNQSSSSARNAEEIMKDYESLASVKAFRELQAAIETQLQSVLRDARNEHEASGATVFLLRTLAMATEIFADANPRAPHFARMDTPGRKVSGDNPDAEYDVTMLHGRHGYKIRGNIGTVRHLSFTFNGGTAGADSARKGTFAYLNASTLGADENGDFTLLLTNTKPEELGTWVQVPDGPFSVLIRQFIANRQAETLASYDIEVIGEQADRLALDPHTDAEIAGALAEMRHVFQFMTGLNHVTYPELFDTPHQFVRSNSDELGADISGSDNLYMFSTFDLDPDEALIIDFEPLEVSYWNITVMTRWHETLDYLKRPTSRTLEEVVTEPDGRVRLVLTHGLAAHPNWLDTAGHRYGVLVFRWVGPRDAVTELPKATLVKASELDSTLAQ